MLKKVYVYFTAGILIVGGLVIAIPYSTAMWSWFFITETNQNCDANGNYVGPALCQDCCGYWGGPDYYLAGFIISIGLALFFFGIVRITKIAKQK